MIALLFKFIYLWLWNLFRPFRVEMDRTDNSVTINESLYKALLFLGIENNNRIFTASLGSGRYGFLLYPPNQDEPANPYYSRLTQCSVGGTLGWASLQPTINMIFYDWYIPVELPTVIVRCTPRLLIGSQQDILYFLYKNPNHD